MSETGKVYVSWRKRCKKVGVFGEPHSFTYLAAGKLLGQFSGLYNIELDPENCTVQINSNPQIVVEVADGGRIQFGVVPLRNRIGGPVTEVYSKLDEFIGRVQIVHSMVTPVLMCSGGLCGPEEVREVMTKDIAARQCSGYISEKWPNAKITCVDSTSEAARIVSEGMERYKYTAVLASTEALHAYGLELFDSDVANAKRNMTRFALLGPPDIKVRRFRGGEDDGITDVTTVAVRPRRVYEGIAGGFGAVAEGSKKTLR